MRSPMSVLIALIENALLILDCAAQQGNSISQTTFQNNLPSQNQNQNLYINDSPNEQNTIKSAGNESPKHSFVQPIKKDNSKSEILTRDPSPFQPEKADTEHQDSITQSFDTIQPIELNRSASHDSNNKDRKESRGSDRSKKKSSWYNVFYSTYKSRSEQLKRYFKDLPSDERLIGDVSAVVKGKTAKVIPNAILISTESEKLFFTTFATRDKAFMMLFRVWQNALMDQTMSTQEVWQWVHTAYGDELGLTSEDEDYNYIPPANSFEDKIYPIERLSADSLSEPQVFGGGSGSGNHEKGANELGSSATDSTNKSQGSVPSQNVMVPELYLKALGNGLFKICINRFTRLRNYYDLAFQKKAKRKACDHSRAFIAENTPSPLQIGEDALPTDLSDTSTESDINPNGEKIMTSCSSTHEGRHVISIILPMHVDQLFTLMFTNSKFFFEFHTMRQSSDIHASTWHQSPESGEKIRTINMVVTLGQALAPKSAHVHQTQVMLPCSVSGQLYSIDDEIVNNGIPYADSFYILMHYCLEKVSEKESSLNIYGQLKYKKSVWGFVKNLIEKTTWSNIKDHNDALVKALLAECDGEMPKGRKGRRRHRAISSNPVLLPVDHLPSSTRSPSYKPVTRKREPENRDNILLGIVLAILVFLVFLNGLLYYKLWLLEDFTQRSSYNFWQADVDILSDPPKSHEEWLKVLRFQENVHKLEVDKWQRVLQSAVDLLKKAEESLGGLQKTIKSPYEAMKKSKQEL
ncbi:hypothetical protein RUM43_013821 [Polyplax serrata]|uniref:VASt domain-containing protein n=1 Tax=Polyplax serrata TaxID=468196 RepID=A0AAN8PRA8_POLSC